MHGWLVVAVVAGLTGGLGVRLVPPGAHRPGSTGCTYVRVGATVLLIGVASGDGGVESAARGVPRRSPRRSRGDLRRVRRLRTHGGEDCSVLSVGDPSLALWRDGAVVALLLDHGPLRWLDGRDAAVAVLRHHGR